MNLKQSILKTSKDKCERMIDLAFELINEVSAKSYGIDDDNEYLKVNIGIHGGKVISDIIGFHKVQFSLFGDPVNTTSRIAHHAENGIVMISEYIYKKIKNHSEYKFIEDQIEVEFLI